MTDTTPDRDNLRLRLSRINDGDLIRVYEDRRTCEHWVEHTPVASGDLVRVREDTTGAWSVEHVTDDDLAGEAR
jgi:hypothetical protein